MNQTPPENQSALSFASHYKNVVTGLMTPTLWLLVALAIAGLCFFFAKFDQSFPAASIDFQLTRPQVAALAADWSRKLGFAVDKGVICSTVFSYDEDCETFLEYELGQQQANQLMKSEIPLWRWSTRFCRPFQLEEMNVDISPQGQLRYFNRTLPNDRALPSVSHARAEEKARDFVEKIAHRSLSAATLVKDGVEQQANRTDHYYTFEDRRRDYRGGYLWTYVYVSGDQITEYNTYLHVPDKFERKFNEIRSHNQLLKNVSSIIYVFLYSAISFIFIWAFASGRIRWKFVLTVGAIGALGTLFSWVDAYPILLNQYQTTVSTEHYWTEQLLQAAKSVLFNFISCLVFAGAMEPAYRLFFPDKMALENIVSKAGLRSKSVFQSLVAGLALFGMDAAYVVGYYLLGNKMGFWSPLEVRESATLNGLCPFYSAVDVGVTASTTEELMYRVLAFGIFKKITGNFWLANFLQAASWAFMHSDYPQEPAYARGIELTIGGFIYGCVLRKFGLLATVVAHYTYDAFLGVTPLLVSASHYDKIAACVAIAPPVVALIVCSIWLLYKGPYKEEQALSNQAVSDQCRRDHVVPVLPAVSFHYRALTNKVKLSILSAALLFAAAALCLHPQQIGFPEVVRISRAEAIERAADYLAQQGINVSGHQSVAVLSDMMTKGDWNSLQYVFEKQGFARTLAMSQSLGPRLAWSVRFFKALTPEEFTVILSADGKPLAQNIVEEEDAAGAGLSVEKARILVDEFIRKMHPELPPLVFNDVTKHQHKRRIDYFFSYKAPSLKVGTADFKVTGGVVGGFVSGFSSGWEIPDQWLYQRNKDYQLGQQYLNYLRQAVYIVSALLFIWWMVGVILSGTIRWRVAMVVALLDAACMLLVEANSLPILMSAYSTEVNPFTFAGDQAVQLLIDMVKGAAAGGLTAAIAAAAYKMMLPFLPLGALFRAAFPGRGVAPLQTRRLWLDALLAGYGFSLVAAGFDKLFNYAFYRWSPTAHTLSFGSIKSLSDQVSPAAGALLGSFNTFMGSLIGVAIATAVVIRFCGRSLTKLAGFALIMSVVAASDAYYACDWGWLAAKYLCQSAIAYVFVSKVARLNVIAYLLIALGSTGGEAVISLLQQGFDVYYSQVAVLILILLFPAAYTAWLYWAPLHTTDLE